MKTVLFVCTGNVCRSPMAEGIFRHITKGSYRVLSAGVGAGLGHLASEYAIQAVETLGIDLSNFRSQPLTAVLMEQADYVFGMTQSHVDAMVAMHPQAADKIFRLREFEESLHPFERDIRDPIGDSYEVYCECRDQIQDGIIAILKFMEHTTAATPMTTLALGADHGGFELKESLKAYLTQRGYQVTDLGAHAPESADDYPDFALPVAQSVANHTAAAGLLVCTTGLGVCMAANKVPGVRAVVASDAETAETSRRHNDANVLCLGGKRTPPELAAQIVEAFLAAKFEGGRHERRVNKMEAIAPSATRRLEGVDSAIFTLVSKERQRQQDNIELIASENFTSAAVMEAQGSVLTNKYAEGYPGKRWYGGCEHVDHAETLAIERAKQVFGAEHVNVQPHSGSQANMAVYFAFLKPGDKMLTMDLSHGGHLTHGNKANFSGKFFETVHYGVRKDSERIDYDQLAEMAQQHRPRMITVGASAYPRIIDFERMGQIAREVGALLLADIAHIAGLVAAGLHPSPVPHADFVTTTTHKTLRGPRGGLIMCPAKYAKEIDSQVFPGIQGGPLMHVIAAKAVCLHEALQPSFKAYQQQILKNAQVLAAGMQRHGYRLVSGGTDNHLMLVDVGARGVTGKECQIILDEAGITANKNTIPFETRSPFQASGIRLGTPAVTTRGMQEPEMALIADLITEVLSNVKELDVAHKVRQRVRELTARYPLPY